MLSRLLHVIILIIFQFSCSTKWTNAIQYGSLDNNAFQETVEIEVVNGLIIMPVKLRGKSYRFLFDTGAPNSISDEIQAELNYKVVSRGHIVDSDDNREKVEYIGIDTIHIGAIPFMDQTAFVGNFDKNPFFECLNIDGIIGSNLMRFCNWTIDYENKEISLTSNDFENNDSPEIPFKTNNQYSLLVNLKTGGVNINNITVDYGSNGSLSIPNSAYSDLKKHRAIQSSFKEIGVSQAGIVGEIIELNRAVTFVDSLWLNEVFAEQVQLKSGSIGLLGSKVLSNWVIRIDWGDRKLYLLEKQEGQPKGTHGFGIGYSSELGTYVQSVIVDGPAYKIGIRPGMKVLKINDDTFNGNESFCALANSMGKIQDTLSVSYEDFEENILDVTLHKKILE